MLWFFLIITLEHQKSSKKIWKSYDFFLLWSSASTCEIISFSMSVICSLLVLARRKASSALLGEVRTRTFVCCCNVKCPIFWNSYQRIIINGYSFWLRPYPFTFWMILGLCNTKAAPQMRLLELVCILNWNIAICAMNYTWWRNSIFPIITLCYCVPLRLSSLECYGFETGAIGESVISNSCYTVWNRDTCETAAIYESTISNTCHTIRNCDIG